MTNLGVAIGLQLALYVIRLLETGEAVVPPPLQSELVVRASTGRAPA